MLGAGVSSWAFFGRPRDFEAGVVAVATFSCAGRLFCRGFPFSTTLLGMEPFVLVAGAFAEIGFGLGSSISVSVWAACIRPRLFERASMSLALRMCFARGLKPEIFVALRSSSASLSSLAVPLERLGRRLRLTSSPHRRLAQSSSLSSPSTASSR